MVSFSLFVAIAVGCYYARLEPCVVTIYLLPTTLSSLAEAVDGVRILASCNSKVAEDRPALGMVPFPDVLSTRVSQKGI